MGVAQWIKWAVWKRLGSGTKDPHCNAQCLSALRWLLHDCKDSRICQRQKCWKQWDLQLHSEGTQAHYGWVGSVYSRRTWFSIIYKVCQNFVWLKERCCTCAKIFMNIADSLGSLAAIVWQSLKQIVAVSFVCPMPKAKFIESTVYTRLYVYVCKMGMYIAD